MGWNPLRIPINPQRVKKKKFISMLELKITCLNLFSMDVFNQVFTLNTAHEIWLKLQELHDGTSNVCEQKHCLAKQSYDSFKIHENKLVRDMYSHLNIIINELNSIRLTKLGDADIVRKIILVLPHSKYATH